MTGMTRGSTQLVVLALALAFGATSAGCYQGLVSSGGPAELAPGTTRSTGTRVCPGCRLSQEIAEQDGTKTVTSVQPNACSDWILANVPGHEHAWSDVGCWSTSSRSGEDIVMTIGQLATPAVLQVSADDWLAFLKARPPELRSTTLAAASGRGALELLETYDRWREEQR